MNRVLFLSCAVILWIAGSQILQSPDPEAVPVGEQISESVVGQTEGQDFETGAVVGQTEGQDFETGAVVRQTKDWAEDTDALIPDQIRVLVLSDDYASPYHDSICISSKEGIVLSAEDLDWTPETEIRAGTIDLNVEEDGAATADPDVKEDSAATVYLNSGEGRDGTISMNEAEENTDTVILSWDNGALMQTESQCWRLPENIPEENSIQKILSITANDDCLLLPELKRGYDCPSYHGSLEIYLTSSGFLMVNELPLETYLCGVVPSEMPASYPAEALKAQAICARTYAVSQIMEQRMQDFPAQVDDSTAYQVYNNQPSSRQTDLAVEETAGIVLMQDGKLADARYYSTSCGLDLHLDLSEEAVFTAFLSEDQLQSWEAEEPMYRWEVQLSADDLGVTGMEISGRGTNGAVEVLTVTEKGQEREIQGEYEIRKFLAKGSPEVTLQDGSLWEASELLPSAFFLMEPVLDGDTVTAYKLQGGGYGHGFGMSQNGAKQMAIHGKTYDEILESYYENCRLTT